MKKNYPVTVNAPYIDYINFECLNDEYFKSVLGFTAAEKEDEEDKIVIKSREGLYVLMMLLNTMTADCLQNCQCIPGDDTTGDINAAVTFAQELSKLDMEILCSGINADEL